jgi:hypothetical protein
MTAAGTVPVLCTIPSFAPSSGAFPTPWGNQTVLDAAIIAWNEDIRTLALRKNVPLFDIWDIAGQAGAGNLVYQEEEDTPGYYIHFSVYGQELVAASLARFLSTEVAGSGTVGGPRALPIPYADPSIVYTLSSLTSHKDSITELEDTTSGLSDVYLRGDYRDLVASSSAAVAVFSFKFIGTGFALFGAMGDEGIITVEVDGNGGEDWDLCQVQDGGLQAIYWGACAWYRKLEEIEHTVTVSVKNSLHTSATNYRFRFLGAMIEGSMLRLLEEKIGLAQRRADANGCALEMTKSRGADTAANDADMIGQVRWLAKNDGTPKTVEAVARLIGNLIDASDGAETGQLQMRIMQSGAEMTAFTIGGATRPAEGVVIDPWGAIGVKYNGILAGTYDKGFIGAWSDTEDTASAKLKFQKSRAGGKPSNGDVLGLVTFESFNETTGAWEIAAFIAGTVPTASDAASTGAIGFATTFNGTFKYHTWMNGEQVLTCAATVTPNAQNGNVFGMALTANVTTMNVPSNAAPGSRFVFRFVQDSTPRTVTWASGYKWAGGDPTVSTGSGAVDVFEVYTPDGTTFYELGRAQNQS